MLIKSGASGKSFERKPGIWQHEVMSTVTPIRPDDEPVDEETMAILDERLKTIDEDAKISAAVARSHG